jgi:membrane-associated protease RseP (regulator of RpoE activity)
MTQQEILLTLLYITIFELILFLINQTESGRKFLSKIGLEISIFTILIKKRGALDLLNKVQKKRWLDILISSGVLIAFISMILFYVGVFFVGIDYVISFIKNMFLGGRGVSGAPPVAPIIPGLTIQGEDIIYLLVAIGVSVVAHELGHAIAAKIDEINLKSYGAGIFLFMPLAFVEVDDNEMLKSKRKSLRILSAGVLFNMIIFAISFLLILFILNITPYLGIVQGAVIQWAEPGLPAYEAGIRPGLLITNINDSRIISLERFIEYRNNYFKPDENITLIIKGVYPNGTILEAVVHKPSNLSIIGVRFDGVSIPLVNFFMGALIIPKEKGYIRLWSLEAFIRILVWLSIINISLAIINAAPLYITDGGKILSIILPKKLSDVIQILTITGFILIFSFSFFSFL